MTGYMNTTVAKPIALIANALFFQGAWLVNVMDLGLLSLLTSAFVVGVHLLMVWHFFGFSAVARESAWLMLATGIGLLVEFLLLYFGILLHEQRADAILGVPLWLLFLWLLFATTFRFSLFFLQKHTILAAALGAFAALSYWAGAALNAGSKLAEPQSFALLCIAMVWALVLPALVIIYRRYFA